MASVGRASGALHVEAPGETANLLDVGLYLLGRRRDLDIE